MNANAIVIVGGGFAGTTLARVLERRLPEGFDIVLVNEESHTTFNPMLPEALGASIFPEQVVAPIRQMLSRARFIMGSVTGIDPAQRVVVARTLAGELRIPYAHLVVAVGSRARLDLVPGLERNGLPLKTVGDAMHIRNVVLRRLAQMELEQDPAVRQRLGRFVVVGGGFAGVESAGELVDCLRAILRYYPGVDRGHVGVTLLHDLPRLLPELPARLGLAAERSLRARGVDVRTNARAAAVSDVAVRLADGTQLDAGTIICTIGTRPNPLVLASGLPLERGRIVVSPDFSIPGVPNVWALGDCAQVLNGHDGRHAPPTAQFAIREARCLGDNLLSAVSGLPTRGFRYRSRGAMAAIGHRKGVAEVLGVPITGLPAWLLWRAYYLSQMPTLGRKVRIFVEWTWGMFFPNDITHLRFRRSAEIED